MADRDNIFITLCKDQSFGGTDTYEILPGERPLDVGNFNTAILYAVGKGMTSAPDVVVETTMDYNQATWPIPVAAFAVTTTGETKQIKATDTTPLYRWLRVKVGKASGSYSGRVTITLLLKR
jgi:hypothetical protein